MANSHVGEYTLCKDFILQFISSENLKRRGNTIVKYGIALQLK